MRPPCVNAKNFSVFFFFASVPRDVRPPSPSAHPRVKTLGAAQLMRCVCRPPSSPSGPTSSPPRLILILIFCSPLLPSPPEKCFAVTFFILFFAFLLFLADHRYHHLPIRRAGDRSSTLDASEAPANYHISRNPCF